MPKLENYKNNASSYGFSAVSLGDLTGTTEYTLVTIAVDKSGSVDGFNTNINSAVAEVVEACRNAPRADNLLIRVVEFDNRLEELHGFKKLLDCNPSDYTDSTMMAPRGSTALFDASLNSVESTINLGKDLTKQDYDVNALVVVITDGADNASNTTAKMVAKTIADAKKQESLESILSILVGVGVAGSSISSVLDNFKTEANFDQYVPLEDAKKNTLSKLAKFISKSITSQSKALGSGTVSNTLTF